MSTTNQNDLPQSIMRGKVTPSHESLCAEVRSTLAASQSNLSQIVKEEWVVPGIGVVPSLEYATNHEGNHSRVMQKATEEWIIPGIGSVSLLDRAVDLVDIPTLTPSPSAPTPESQSQPDWATPIDEGFIHPEGYTTKIVGIDSILASRLADASAPPSTAEDSTAISAPKKNANKDRAVKTPPPTPGPSPSSPSKQTGVKTTSPTPSSPLNTPSQKSLGPQSCMKAAHPPGYLPSSSKCARTNRVVEFVDEIEVIPYGSFEPTPSADKEQERSKFHCQQTSANVLELVQEIKLPDNIAGQMNRSKDGNPPPKPSMPQFPLKKTDERVLDHGVKTPSPSLEPPRNLPSNRLSKDGTPPPPSPPLDASSKEPLKDGTLPRPSSPPPNWPLKQLPKEGMPLPTPSLPLNHPDKKLSKDGPYPSSPVAPNTPTKRIMKITDFFKLIKEQSPPPPPPPPPTTPSEGLNNGSGGSDIPLSPSSPLTSPSKKLDKGGGGGGTPPPPSPPPNSPTTELSGNDMHAPSPSPPSNTRSETLSRLRAHQLTLTIPDDDGESYNLTKPKSTRHRNRRHSLVNYISDDDYPSPDPGSDSPITPLWLEMKDMVDKFICKTEEAEGEGNMAKKLEYIQLPPIEPTSLLMEAQSENLSLMPRKLTSLDGATIPLRVDEKERVKVEVKDGAELKDSDVEEHTLGPFGRVEAWLNASIAADVEKMIRYLVAWEEENFTAGEAETAWNVGQNALMFKDDAALHAVKDVCKDGQQQNTPQGIGPLLHIQPNSINMQFDSPKSIRNHATENGEARKTVIYLFREKYEVEISLIYDARGASLLVVPMWKKDLYKLLPLPARSIRRALARNGESPLSMSFEGIGSGLLTFLMDAARLGLGVDSVRPGTKPTAIAVATSTTADSTSGLIL